MPKKTAEEKQAEKDAKIAEQKAKKKAVFDKRRDKNRDIEMALPRFKNLFIDTVEDKSTFKAFQKSMNGKIKNKEIKNRMLYSEWEALFNQG
jgi:pyruvate dehydrogenase complex dehydrogenase (E1) component